MRTVPRLTAATQFALILPAALFLAAVLVGAGDAPQYDLARMAHRIVIWYSARMWTLWLLLLILPFAVLVSGCATLFRTWKHDAATMPSPLAALVVAGTTLASAGTLAVVVLHMLAN